MILLKNFPYAEMKIDAFFEESFEIRPLLLQLPELAVGGILHNI